MRILNEKTYLKTAKTALILIFFICIFSANNVFSQISNVNDETYLLLALKKDKIRFEQIKKSFENSKNLYEKRLISEEQFLREKSTYDVGLINYQQAMLRVIFDQPYIIVEEALKYQDKNGKKRVKLKLKNTTGGTFDYEKVLKSEGTLFSEELKPDKINNVFVSLVNPQDNTIISKPYERKIKKISFGTSEIVDFELLRDVEAVRVTMIYADATHTKDIYLEKDASANMVDVSSVQFSQEAELAGNASYDLSLERFSMEDDVYELHVINMPTNISYNFQDPSNGARLSSVKFAKGITSKNLALRVFLPERDDADIIIDQPINFYVAVLTKAEAEKWGGDFRNKKLTEKEIETLLGGREKLELIPMGVGKIEVRLNVLYYDLKTDEDLTFNVTIKNTGTRRLDNIKLDTDHPLNWDVSMDPDLIRSLEVGKETIVKFTVKATGEEGVGDYNIKIKTESLADNRRVETEDKEVRIHIDAPANIMITLGLIILVLGITSGIVIFGIKLSRR